jgi:hypothetical protein
MDQIFTGPNHSCAISVSKSLFIWGYNSMTNRLGSETLRDSEEAEVQPTSLWAFE